MTEQEAKGPSQVGPTYPCLPSLGEHCGHCHRCTDPDETTPPYQAGPRQVSSWTCPECEELFPHGDGSKVQHYREHVQQALSPRAREAVAEVVRVVQEAMCPHCGALPDVDGDHSCPCPYSDDDCKEHQPCRRGEFVNGLGWSCVTHDTFGCPGVHPSAKPGSTS